MQTLGLRLHNSHKRTTKKFSPSSRSKFLVYPHLVTTTEKRKTRDKIEFLRINGMNQCVRVSKYIGGTATSRPSARRNEMSTKSAAASCSAACFSAVDFSNNLNTVFFLLFLFFFFFFLLVYYFGISRKERTCRVKNEYHRAWSAATRTTTRRLCATSSDGGNIEKTEEDEEFERLQNVDAFEELVRIGKRKRG